jgi:hypothetical protein
MYMYMYGYREGVHMVNVVWHIFGKLITIKGRFMIICKRCIIRWNFVIDHRNHNGIVHDSCRYDLDGSIFQVSILVQ